ncbi:hypothetical protein [Ensifer sp. 4252]|uniref:hypothetical protein n=1 Tax=Ensifer sp. 4252 TaxID=3373915 RepID=UPI003D26072B
MGDGRSAIEVGPDEPAPPVEVVGFPVADHMMVDRLALHDKAIDCWRFDDLLQEQAMAAFGT